MQTSFKTLNISRDGAVLVIKLDSPKTRNSLTAELRQELGAVVATAETDRSVRAVYLTGNGPTFCSGGDFKMLQKASDPWSVHRRFRGLQRWLLPLLYLEKPVVVGVNGPAVGGGMGLALSGDILIAGASATFVSGFFRLGAVPDIGMMYHLPRLIGMARAKNF
ncbi:MAG: enoyl-CoA hydratase/isomerase family protein, partial [Hyphomicrobium sp.]|nr:enoyl-CoA hydratase/isomerase family protein [Hyphomicrobium sp.]